VNRKDLVAAVEMAEKDYRMPKLFWIKRQLLHPVLSGLAKNTYDFMNLGKYIWFLTGKLGITSKAVCRCERKGQRPNFIGHKFPNALAKLALKQFMKLERLNTHRTMIANYYMKNLREDIAYQRQAAGGIYFRFLLKVKNAKELMHLAKEQKILLGDWYTSSLAPAGVNYEDVGFDPRLTPNAEILAKESINLPTSISISLGDAQRIVDFINEHAS